MSKTSMFVLLIGLVMGITGVTLFLYGMNSGQSEIPVASVSESMNSDENIASEGIKIHGNWELTVSDPDGSDPVVYNFQNTIHEHAFDVMSRLLLPADHENSSQIDYWEVQLIDGLYAESGGSISGYVICPMSTKSDGLNQELYDNSVLVAEPIATDDEFYGNGMRLTGSCMAGEPGTDQDNNDVIDINTILVQADYRYKPNHYWKTEFATKVFGGPAGEIEAGGENEENAIIIDSPGQMVSVTIDFTFK